MNGAGILEGFSRIYACIGISALVFTAPLHRRKNKSFTIDFIPSLLLPHVYLYYVVLVPSPPLD